MDSAVLFIMAIAAIAVFIKYLWYLFQKLRAMQDYYNALVTIAAVFFSPLVHMFFYLFPKYGFDNQDKRLFQRYCLSIGVIIIVAIVAAIVIFATTQN